MPGYWNAHSDLDWQDATSIPLPAKPQFPLSYFWHLGPIYEDREALEDRAELVELEREAMAVCMVAADERGDMAAYERAEEEFALADRELSLLQKRIEELQ